MKIKNRREIEVGEVGLSTLVQNHQLLKENRIQSIPRTGNKLRDKELRVGLAALKKEISMCCSREISQLGDNTRQQESKQEDRMMKRILPPLREYQRIRDQQSYLEIDVCKHNIKLKTNDNDFRNKCKAYEQHKYEQRQQQQFVKNTTATAATSATTNNNSRDESYIQEQQRYGKQDGQLRKGDNYELFYQPKQLTKSQSEKYYFQINLKNKLKKQVLKPFDNIKGMNQATSSYFTEDQQSFVLNKEFSDQNLRITKQNHRNSNSTKISESNDARYQQQQDLRDQQNQGKSNIFDHSYFEKTTEDYYNPGLLSEKCWKQYHEKKQLQKQNSVISENQSNEQISSSQKIYLAIKEQQQQKQILMYSSLEKQQKEINQKIKLKQLKLEKIINSNKTTPQILPPQIQACLYPSLPVRISSPIHQQNIKQQGIENNSFLQLRSYFSNKYEQHKIKQCPFKLQDQLIPNNDSFLLPQEARTSPNNYQLDSIDILTKKFDKNLTKDSGKRFSNRATQMISESISPYSTGYRNKDEIVPWESNLDEYQGEDENTIIENIQS